MPDIVLIVFAAVFVFISGLMFHARWFIRGTIVGILALGLVIVKEIRIHSASDDAQDIRNQLKLKVDQLSTELKEQNEKMSKLLAKQDMEQKYHETIDYTLDSQKRLIKKWSSIIGYFEITRADCKFYITMHYEKNVDVIDQMRIEEFIDVLLPSGPVKEKVLDILQIRGLREKFENSVRMKQSMSDSFGVGSVVNSALVIHHLIGVEDKSLLSLPWIRPIVFEIQPSPEFENQDCQIGVYSP